MAATAGFELAQAWWAVGSQKARADARAAARGALEIHEADGNADATKEVRTWLAAHGDK
jgi:hypothetical protein